MSKSVMDRFIISINHLGTSSKIKKIKKVIWLANKFYRSFIILRGSLIGQVLSLLLNGHEFESFQDH